MNLTQYRTKITSHTRDYGTLQWTTTMIDESLNEGYREFARRTECLRKSGSIALTPETATFALPSDCVRVYRIEHNKKPVTILSDDAMDAAYGADWRETQGDAVKIVTMQMTGPDTLRIYPVFRDFDGVSYDIDEIHDKLIVSYDGGTATTVDIDNGCYSGDSLATQLQSNLDDELGCTSTVTFSETTGKFTLNAGTGHTFAITYSGSTAADRIGILVNKTAAQTITTDYSVRLWLDYVYRPAELSTTSDDPDFPEEYHPALYHFVLREILLHNVESEQSYILAQYHASIYERYINAAKVVSDTDFVRSERRVMANPWI